MAKTGAKARATKKPTPPEETQEPAVKANPDYSETAENLCNPPEVKMLLDDIHQKQTHLDSLEKQLMAQNEDLANSIELTKREVSDLTKELKEAISQYGSFQDIESGIYAVKYRIVHKEYHAEPFEKHFEQFAPAVIKKAVDREVLKPLVKGGAIKEETLKELGILTERVNHGFFIR